MKDKAEDGTCSKVESYHTVNMREGAPLYELLFRRQLRSCSQRLTLEPKSMMLHPEPYINNILVVICGF
jgi:hypothetical protein